MRPSPVLLRNVHTLAALLRNVIGPGRPPRCYFCDRDLAPVQERYNRWDPIDRVWIGFLECPGCRAEYVFTRP